MVVLIQKRAIDLRNDDASNITERSLMPPFKTIMRLKALYWKNRGELEAFLSEKFGVGTYQIRVCNGGNKGLKTFLIDVFSRNDIHQIKPIKSEKNIGI